MRKFLEFLFFFFFIIEFVLFMLALNHFVGENNPDASQKKREQMHIDSCYKSEQLEHLIEFKDSVLNQKNIR